MYIPITKTEEKCAGQLSYGFNILNKLESCPHEKFFPYGDLDFVKKKIQKYRILHKGFLSKILEFSEISFKGISFGKLTPPTLF